MASLSMPRHKRILLKALERAGVAPVVIDLRERAGYLRDGDARRRNAEFRPPDGLPLPPPWLVHRVVGHYDQRVFYEGGVRRFAYIRDLLEEADVDIGSLGAVLDWGCGCGRVLRQWRGLRDVDLYGSDYNEDLVAWCRRNLMFASVETNGLVPPLPFPNDSFDLIYAISVFTHLDEPLQVPWIEELERIAKPGGHILITVKGDGVDLDFDSAEQARFDAGEPVVRGAFQGSNFCAVTHPEPYVRNVLAERLEVVVARPAADPAFDYGQDGYILRVPTS
jgi:SAM-dependent methyltransferase